MKQANIAGGAEDDDIAGRILVMVESPCVAEKTVRRHHI
jgi:hypothetical protein